MSENEFHHCVSDIVNCTYSVIRALVRELDLKVCQINFDFMILSLYALILLSFIARLFRASQDLKLKSKCILLYLLGQLKFIFGL